MISNNIKEENSIHIPSVMTVFKALLSGHEISIEQGTFRYFRKGDWIEIDENSEGEVSQDGVFKKCDVIHHNRSALDYRWLLWFNSISDLIHFVESISPHELALIAANLTISENK